MERKVRAWEFIEEDDGSTTLMVEYADGGRDEFRGVEFKDVQETPAVGTSVSVPLSVMWVKS